MLVISYKHKNYSSWSKLLFPLSFFSLKVYDGFKSKKGCIFLEVTEVLCYKASTLCPVLRFSPLILERAKHVCSFIHTHFYAHIVF